MLLLTELQKETLQWKYEVKRLIGEGPYSEVYLAIRKVDGQPVAIKILDKNMVHRHKKVDAVMNERRALEVFRGCPFVNQLLESMQDEDNLYLVKAYAHNLDLGTFIREGGYLDEETSKQIIYGTYKALECIHHRGHAHRDVKPENILIDYEMRPWLNDLECVYDIINAEREPGFEGTAAYQSPEVINGLCTRANIREQDWWALACTVFYIFAKKHLFYASTEYLVFERVLHVQAIEHVDGMPAWAQEIIETGILYKNYQKMCELIGDLVCTDGHK